MNIIYHHRTRGEYVERVHILGMARAFKKLGHDVKIVSPPGVNPDKERTVLDSRESQRNGFWRFISLYFPEAIFEMLEVFYNLLASLRLIAVTRGKKVDLIYERYALFSFAAVFLSRKLGIPIILEVNDSASVKRIRNLFFLETANRIEQWVFSHASLVVTVSEALRKIIIARGVEEKKVIVTPNAVDPDDFTMSVERKGLIARRYKLHEKIVIGYVGGFTYWHRLELLLDIIANLIEIFPNIHCLLVGDGVSRPSLTEKVRELGLEKYFTFPGKCRHNQIAAYISAMDITILPHSNDYCSPVKLFEYMALGKPVLAPRLPNVKEIIIPSVNGVLFEPGSKKDLENKLIIMIEDSKLRRNLGRNAIRTVCEKHLWIHNARKIMQICGSLGICAAKY